jgi:hypothetical protein
MKKTCFVVMGFGEKTDFQSSPQRVLDLNRTFEDIIEPAVTDCDVECIRADKIIHSTVIDKPMYEQLLAADLVIADLSTSNANAIYELGVRHALRPYTTIVIAEKGFAFPFDLSHLSILKYEHLGKEIGFREVMRIRDELKKKINALINKKDVDSPVFLFLPNLLANGAVAPAAAATTPPQDDKSFAELMQALRETLSQAKRDVSTAADWLLVVAVLNRLMKLQPNDPYIVQQLALATYKSKQPDPVQALNKAKEILSVLGPDTSSDAETVGLWGAIHKRLWDLGKAPGDLSTAVRAYARGYFIKNDYYNGINFAFLLNVRAAISQGDDAIADRVIARRTRNEVLELCDAALASGTLKGDDTFWVSATKVEALLGLGRKAESDALSQQLGEIKPPTVLVPLPVPVAAPWMIDTMKDQLNKLAALNP